MALSAIFPIVILQVRRIFEEFFTAGERLDMETVPKNIGVIKNEPDFNANELDYFINGINILRQKDSWKKEDILELFMFCYLISSIRRLVNI